MVNTPKRSYSGDKMTQQFINIGNQSNDGTGDSIREAFSKVNNNFGDLYDFLDTEQGFRFENLEDFPSGDLGDGGQIVTTAVVTSGTGIDAVTSTILVLRNIVAGEGMAITVSPSGGNILVTNSTSRLITDQNPTLIANLVGTSPTPNTVTNTTFHRARDFQVAPISDFDLVNRKFLYDNFLSRDGTRRSGTETGTSTFLADTGSVLTANISLLPTSSTFLIPELTRFIKVFESTSTSTTVYKFVDVAPQATSSSHITRKDYVDTKISLQGIDTIDPATGNTNTSFGVMTGPLILSRDPVTQDDFAPFEGKIAATKAYVDRNDFYSDNNLFVTVKGSDYQPLIPPIRRGRAPQYAFATLNKAAQYAEQLIATSRIQVGDYNRNITYDDGIPATVFDVTENFYGNNLARLRLEVGTNGSDQFGATAVGRNKIFPGQYVQGVDSGAIALIENISQAPSPGSPEVYSIAYVDYADDFETKIFVDSYPIPGNFDIVRMRFEDDQIVPVPQFWIGYKFYTDTGVDNGIIVAVGDTVDDAGIYVNTFDVEFPAGLAPNPGTNEYEGPDWHVYANDFEVGETVVYNTNVSALQISFIIESGEYYEQLPIKLPANTSIRGDEFRRVLIRPAKGVSSSPWADIYFRRDAQIDGLATAELEDGNFAPNVAVTPSGSSGLISVALAAGTLSPDYAGYVFIGNGGRGIIEDINGAIFSVNLGTPMVDALAIASGSWQIRRPITFGRHYLTRTDLPQNNLTTLTNAGGYYNGSVELTSNKEFFQQEAFAFANLRRIENSLNVGNPWYGYTVDEDAYKKNAGIIVDSLAQDLVLGGNGRIVSSAVDFAADAELFQSIPFIETVVHLSTVTQLAVTGQTITATTGNTVVYTSSTLVIQSGADSQVADLLQATVEIVNGNPDFNPAKNNSELDVLLMNDANVIRYISVQNHGGFMQVLDPEGQIKNKSPYTQTASAFSQSKEKQVFAGGMFVDGFTGNVIADVEDFSNPLELEVSGLRRRPQVPTFFMDQGIRYEVSFFADFRLDQTITSSNGVAEPFYSATLRLNPLNPGGIPNTVSVTDTVGTWRPSTQIPITIEQPSGIGGLSATGYAVSNSVGRITSIVIEFPGSGYINTPFISIGGAIFNNLAISGGGITAVNIVSGGSGHTVGTAFEIIPVGIIGGVSARGQVSSVDANGAITGVTFITNGAGWDTSVGYRVTFGDLDIVVPTPQPGFINSTVPTTVELVTAGNRSMLANDFTQVNDLGYGIFCTNGSYMENVSMFTYYNYRSYFALNGAQIRTTTGSTCYGEYGLVSDGSDPMEVPLDVTLPLPLVQIASAYVANPLYPAQQGQSFIYVEIDSLNGGYPPLSGSTIEINHSGIRRNYAVGSASPALDSSNITIPNVFQLSFNTGNVAAGNDAVGLLSAVNSGDPIIIRAGNLVKLIGFNPASITRPATTLVWNDDPAQVYFVTDFSTLQPDGSVLTYTASEYNYITFQTVDQGMTLPTVTFGGSNYSTSTILNISTVGLPSGITTTVNGDQGLGTIGIQTISVADATNVVPGQVVSGTNIISNSYVTYVDYPNDIICLNQPTSGSISSGTVLTFNAVQPAVTLNITSGTIVSTTVDNGGAGWTVISTPVVVVGTGTGALISTPVAIAGVQGSSIIKITTLDLTSENKITSGLLASPQRLYQFALGDQIYNITGYRDPTATGTTWSEIDIDPPLEETITRGVIVRAGIPISSKGKLTTKISVMRASSHDFVSVGTGGYATTRYPNDLYGPPLQRASTTREVVEVNKGRVFYVSTDQDGNFRVGRALTVNQNRGSVSISVPLDLSNLSSVSLRRDLGPPINEFSIDSTMVAEADFKVPTEQAVANYVNRRLGLDRNGNIYAGSPLGPQFLALSGVLAMKGSINMDDNRITNLNVPRQGFGSDAVNKDYTDGKLSNAGTASRDVDTTTLRPEWGRMTGSLQLFNDARVKTATVATTATINADRLTFTSLTSLGNYRPGDFIRHRVYGLGIPPETYVSVVFQDGVTLGLGDINDVSILTNAPIPPGTVLTFDPIFQAATKRSVDANRQLSQLVDVSLADVQDQDFLMFTNTVLAANSSTNPPIYSTATQIVNVTNNEVAPLNTPVSVGGGSDIFVTRTPGLVTFKLVGGTPNEATNPITDIHINSFAQIKQAKLLMNTATTQVAPTVGTQTQIQATLGLANFDSRMFTATSGWVTLVDSTGTTSGVQTTKQAWVPTGGGFLGATNTAADTAATYVSSSTMKVWLQNESTNWRYSSTLIPNSDITYDLGSTALRWRDIYASTATLTGGLTLNTSSIIRGNQTTAWIFSTTVTTGNLFLAGTEVNIGALAGRINVPATIASNNTTVNLVNTTATTVNAFGDAATLNLGNATAATVTLRPGTLVGSNTTQNLYNTVATTVNAFGEATTINVGAAGANTFTLNHGTLVGSQTTQNVFNTAATTVNAFGAATTANVGSGATTMRIGGTSGTLTIGNTTVVGTGATQNLYNSVASTLNIGSAASTVRIGAASGTLTIGNTIVVGAGASQDLYNTVATTMNFAGAATTLNIGNASGANLIRGTTTLNVLAADGDGSQVTGNWTLSGGATFQATFADLAEWYGADAEYESGTVLIFGGESEVTLTTISNDSRVAGVVTTDPAYIMNVGQEGTRACIALQGRVPVKVTGTIRKGDMLTTSSIPGYACKAMNPTVGTIIGKALENKDDPGTGTIQVAIGRM